VKAAEDNTQKNKYDHVSVKHYAEKQGVGYILPTGHNFCQLKPYTARQVNRTYYQENKWRFKSVILNPLLSHKFLSKRDETFSQGNTLLCIQFTNSIAKCMRS
jgi:hypothetical protein